ncbi:MAG: glycosyltransferase [Flavobacteriales bacterium]|nr:glycosyltransferase [Flavobacteriales bacterium]
MPIWPIETWLMAGALLVLLAYHAFMFAPFALRKITVEPDRELPISVVICARNEARTLETLIPLLMEQDHREFEVVVVNDRSEDDTWEILQWMKPDHPRLRPVNIQADEKFSYGKKIALGVGVRAAKHPHVLLTDADCLPPGRDWISTMAAGFRNGRSIVIGHSPYAPSPGLSGVLEGYDGCVKALQYLAFARAGLPYMGVGRNLGYATEVFYRARDRQRGNHLMSGDDDLFINAVANARNTAMVADPRSFMTTRATPGLAAWIRRKRRHYTTAAHYRFGHQVLLMLLPAARLLFWTALVLLAIRSEWTAFAIGAAIKVLLLLPITMAGLRRLHAGAIAWAAMPLEWLFLLLDPMLYASTILVKPKRWK